jgi:transcriptional regulator with XRE-family HTH domain
MIERFKQLLESLHLSPSEFADRIGVQRSSISHIISGRNKPSIDFLEKILLAFPETDINYLITGKEKPVKQSNQLFTHHEITPFNKIKTEQAKDHEKETPAPLTQGPVEKIIIVYRDNTFRILDPFEG